MISTAKKIAKKQSLVVLFSGDKLHAQQLPGIDDHWMTLIDDRIKASLVKEKEYVVFQTELTAKAPRIALANIGASDAVANLRCLAGQLAREFKKESGIQWICVDGPSDWAFHVGQSIAMGLYKVPNQKSDEKPDNKPSKHLIITSEKTLVGHGEIVGEAVNKARSFANLPANVLTTTQFVADIKALFKGVKNVSVTVLNEAAMKKKNMHALLGVGQGSMYPSYLVDISYNGGTGKPICIVGKGVMFDTGGISIKPSHKMKEMKGDMGGAAAVVAAAWAVAQMGVKKKVSFIVPIVENMVSATAQRPGDVVVASNGTSIEITNTDAEGRLILADALVYATKKKPSCLVDIATLTGASVIALGPYAISVLGNHQGVVDQLIAASASYNERCWQLPLFDDYKDLLKSDVADVLNANEGREAGTITAAKFLECFVGKLPWAHLDIASTMSVSGTKGDMVKGMTGAGTRALISFVNATLPV
jgi:leucyl aminopeptidase